MANELAENLNRDCYCIAVDREALHDRLEAHLRDSGLPEQLLDANSHLFADSPVFPGQEYLREMERLIGAVEKVARNSAYRERVLATAPVPTRQDFGPAAQYLYAEFLLFQSLFERHGIEAIVADPRDFSIKEGALGPLD